MAGDKTGRMRRWHRLGQGFEQTGELAPGRWKTSGRRGWDVISLH